MSEAVNAGSDSEEFGLICKCEGDTIDLLLDTGTVSNLVPEDQRGVVQNIRSENTSLIGVGGNWASRCIWEVEDRSWDRRYLYLAETIWWKVPDD